MSATLVLIGSLVFMVLLLGAIFWKMPDWSRPELLFAVTVPAEVRRSGTGRAIIARFRHRVGWISLAAAMAALLPVLLTDRVDASTFVFSFVVTAQLVAIAWAFLSARRESQPLAVAPGGRREAAVTLESQRLPGGFFGQAGPFLLFALVFAFLAWKWPNMPDRYITHWNGRFQPDGWSDKSALLVFGLPAIGLVVCAMFPPIAWSLLNRSRRVHLRGAAAQIETTRRKAVTTLLLWLEYLMVLIFAPMGLLPFAQTPSSAKALTVTTLVLSIGGPLLMIVVWFVRYGSALTTSTRGAEAAAGEAPVGDRTEDRFWKWGLIYYNPEDPVLWVEKRFGVGYTFNMARPGAWWILSAMILLPLAVAIAIALMS